MYVFIRDGMTKCQESPDSNDSEDVVAMDEEGTPKGVRSVYT